MAELDKLEIVVTADTKGAESSISSLCKRLAELQGRINAISIKGLGQKISSISKALDAGRTVKDLGSVNKAVERTARTLTKAGKIQDPYWSADAIRQRSLANLEKTYQGHVASQNAQRMQALMQRHGGVNPVTGYKASTGTYKQNWEAYQRSLEQYTTRRSWGGVGADELGKSARAAMGLADNMDRAGASIREVQDAISSIGQTASGGFPAIQEAGGGITSWLQGLTGGLPGRLAQIAENLKTAGSAALDFGKAVGSAAIHGFGSVMQGLLRPVTRLRDGFTNMTTALQGLLSRFGRLAVTRLFRMAIQAIGRAISEGINNVYQYSAALNGSFKGAMDSAATSMQYFKNSIGAAAAPLIQTFIPYLNAAVSAIVTFINIINQLFAALGGAVSFTRAKKSVTEFGKAAKGAGGGAGKAAKEMDKFLASWDEITNIKTPDDSGGGGGGGGGAGDFLDMFEEAPIDQAILDAINSGNWYGLGELLAQKLNDILPSEEQMYAWGRRLGELINNGINVALGFMRTFNFVGLGQRISMWLNGAISAIEWDKLGALIMRQTLALWDMAIGFIQRLDFGQIARAVSDLLLGAWRELTNWLNGWDWSEMGRMVADKIIDFLTNIKWEELGQTLWELFNAGVKAAADFFTALDEVFSEKLGPIWDVVKGIGAAFLLWKLADGLLGGLDLVSDVLALINTTTVGIGLILTGVYTLVQGIIDQVTNGLSWDSLGTQIGGIIILLGGLYLLLGPIGVAIGAIVTGITEFILGLKEWMEVGKPSNEILTQMSVGIGLIGAGIALLTGAWIPLLIAGIGIAVLWIVGKWDEIKQKAAEVWEKIKEIWGVAVEWFKDTVITPIAELFESIKAGIKLAFDAAWEFVRDKWSAVAEWFSMTVIGPLKLVFEPIKAAIEGFLNDPIGTIQTAWTTFAEWFNTTFIIPVTTYFNSLKANIELGFEAAKQFIMDSWLTVAEWFNTTIITPVVSYFNSLKANIELAFEAAKQFVTDAWSTVSEWFSTNVTTPIQNVFSPLEGAITGFLSNPVGAIKQAWVNIKQWFQDTIITPISTAFSGLGSTIKSAFFGGINSVINGLNWFIGKVNAVGVDFDGYSVETFWGPLQVMPAVHLHPFSLPTIPTLEYAEGGFPTEGEMFIAREAGPELVGRMGNRSAVANNDQIVEGIRQGVYEAMVAANSGQNSREVKVYIDGKEITDYTRKRSNQMARALGV